MDSINSSRVAKIHQLVFNFSMWFSAMSYEYRPYILSS